jgi:hypothetical protein
MLLPVLRFAAAALLAFLLPFAAVAANNARTSAQPIAAATANAALTADLFQNESVIAFNVTGLTAAGATLTIEGSSDGRNDTDAAKVWFAINGNTLPGGSPTGFTTVNSDQAFRVDVAGLTNVRVRVSTTGTGTILVGFNAIPGASLGPGGSQGFITGNVGGFDSGTAPATTLTAANSSHVLGTAVGGLFQVPIARIAGGAGDMSYLSIQSSAGDTTPLLVRAWDRKPTSTSPNFACTDNAAYSAGSPADDAHLLTGIPFTLTPIISTPSTGDAKTYASWAYVPPVSFKNQDATPTQFIYVCLVATATFTPGAGVYYVNVGGPLD